ncbi:hypothetical protein CANTEDRAFT_112431 [Yamadazyma tenuis ATCC 10573]|uniref:Exoribonuclease phosphorolytic domain-containing protein n=1 Tax=Candida tenuis (strain ATCC 10573 / BCRC 21748 / CBS 615 / JCM 9827 / NBRC 10315 / NRRL Y-1498 / VKM Y-70) TaxID=590646 RepID=G3AX55_CANTC|nr:uncharacterized protein CANTEDRAFT_112431 [Yamadazyma tenuis ATCC 10573]EGV66881.1 hypothetical protein CANTEDRAFT_112431 [Yamadazyma tenuis ATCC 10573]
MESISFKPEILERIIPDVSLERHLKIGIRSNQRLFDEFKNIQILSQKSSHLLTTSYIQNGNTLVICNISYGITELLGGETPEQYSSVYPTLSISRGRSGAPTDEEMNLSQKLYESTLHSRILPSNSLIFKPKVMIDDNLEDLDTNKQFKFNLFVNLKVFDRSGPLFDVCHFALVTSLKAVKLPVIYLNDSFVKLSIDNLLAYPDAELVPLRLNMEVPLVSSNFGLYNLDEKNLIICDLENESEESNIISKVNVVSDVS